jgi:hypothetical protein
MRPPGPTVVAAVAIGAAVVIVVVALALPGHGSTRSQSSNFDFSQNLPTGSTVSNGQMGCGVNVTQTLTVPDYSHVYLHFTVNQTGDSANVWMTGPGPDDRGFLSVSWVGMSGEELGVSIGGQIHFFLQGCGPGPTVPLGLWGNISGGIFIP